MKGDIPTKIGQLTQLESLGFGGRIPAEIGQLLLLEYLDLENVYSPVPTELGLLSKLKKFSHVRYGEEWSTATSRRVEVGSMATS